MASCRSPATRRATLEALNASYRDEVRFPVHHLRAGATRARRSCAQLRQRMTNSIDQELANALDEIAHITRLRLVDRVTGAGMPNVAGRLSTHVLDTHAGRPAQGVKIELFELGHAGPVRLAEATTNAEGRTDQPLLAGAPLRIGTVRAGVPHGRLLSRARCHRHGRSPSSTRCASGSASASRRATITCRWSRRPGATRPIAAADGRGFTRSRDGTSGRPVCVGSGHFRTTVTRLWRHARTTSLQLPATPASCNIVCAIPPCWRHRPCNRHRRATRFGTGLCLRSSSPPSTSTTTYASSCSASIDASPASTGRSCSSTMIPPTAPLEVLRDLSRADARVRHLQRIGRRGLASAVRRGNPVDQRALSSPSWTPTCSTTRASSPRCCGGSASPTAISSSARATSATGGTGRLEQGAAADQRCRHAADAPRAAHHGLRPDERLLHAEARTPSTRAVRRLSSTGYKILLDILVSAPRPLARGGGALRLPQPRSTARASSIRGDAGIPHAAARQDGRAVRAGAAS